MENEEGDERYTESGHMLVEDVRVAVEEDGLMVPGSLDTAVGRFRMREQEWMEEPDMKK